MKNPATRLNRVLQQLFRQQAMDVMSRIDLEGPAPDVTAWTDAMAEASQPIIAETWCQGMTQSAARVAAKLGKRDEVEMPKAPRPKKGLWRQGGRIVHKGSKPHLDFSFDLFNPKVLTAVDALTLTFCRETNETATRELDEALRDLRALMAAGLARGEAIALLAKKVRTIFADPMRAFRIAATETSRAVHGGQALAAQQIGIEKHSWLASADACDRCLALNGKTVKIGEPFWVNPKGGPYAVVLYPPLHPTCFCTTTEEL